MAFKIEDLPVCSGLAYPDAQCRRFFAESMLPAMDRHGIVGGFASATSWSLNVDINPSGILNDIELDAIVAWRTTSLFPTRAFDIPS